MALALEKNQDTYLYLQVIKLIKDMQKDGLLRAGEKLPSLRKLANTLAVSVPTVKQAYLELERQGYLFARAKSGYYLKPSVIPQLKPKKASAALIPLVVSRQQLIEQFSNALHHPHNVPLGVANPVATYPASKALNRIARRVMSLAGDNALNYGPSNGFEPLRRQLAYRYLSYGMQTNPNDIIITNGAQEALSLALQAVAKAGDIIAVESPCYYGLLELIESLQMLALEIPLCAEEGLSVEDVKAAISHHPVKACIFSTTISNPLGCIIKDNSKRAIVELLEASHIPFIEDDVYGDLSFNLPRGLPAQAFSKSGGVLTCSSFSKTVAPGYRIGWILAPGYIANLAPLKRALSSSSPLLNQWILAEFMRGGDFDRYLQQLKQALQTNKERMLALIRAHFNPQIRVTDPQGGAVLWLELPPYMDGDRIFQQALSEHISVAPGTLFSPSNKYQHCIRLSYGLPWSAQVESAIQRLGLLCRE
jgi:DNA-binding transcriptional MocR family regulator